MKLVINNYRNWDRVSITCWIHKRHPICRLMGELWGVFCEYLWQNWVHYNGNALHVYAMIAWDISHRRVYKRWLLIGMVSSQCQAIFSHHIHRNTGYQVNSSWWCNDTFCINGPWWRESNMTSGFTCGKCFSDRCKGLIYNVELWCSFDANK